MWLNKHAYGYNILWHGIFWHDNDMPGKVWDEISIHTQTSTPEPFMFENGYVISSHAL